MKPVPEALNAIAKVVLAYRPKPKAKAAKRRVRRARDQLWELARKAKRGG